MIKIYRKIPSDLLVILIWVIATFIFVISPVLQNSIIRTILGIPIVLFIPGYVLVTTLFPKKDDLDSIERIALSFGLSIAIVPLLGLALNFTFGIRLIPILATLTIYSIVLIIVATYRRNKLMVEEQFYINFEKIYDLIDDIKIQNRIDKILTIALIFSIVFAIGTLIYVVITPKIGERFTEFYILNSSSEKAYNYSTDLKSGESSDIIIGVVNHEYSIVNYTVQTILDKNVLNSEKLTLGNNKTWEKNITFVPDKTGPELKLRFLLFKENNFSRPYRDLHLWINVT